MCMGRCMCMCICMCMCMCICVTMCICMCMLYACVCICCMCICIYVPPWITPSLKSMIKRRNRMLKNYKRRGFKTDDKIRVNKFHEDCNLAVTSI